MSASELWRLTATEAVGLLKRGEVSPLEMIDAAALRIEATDGALNALPTLCLERARDHAGRLMAAGGDSLLAGLPIAIKDLVDVAGVRTTYGSPIYENHVPTRSDILVETLEANGAVVIGKSNTPEFGAGASTFNEVFGKTRNPWNTDKSVAGSSGGAVAALAAGQAWLATGSDLGGSLRTPASFCSVVGLRPSPGRVARGPTTEPFNSLSVAGPMARNPDDAALFLDAMTGQHGEDPMSLAAPAVAFADTVAARRMPKRIGYSPDLGIMPIDSEVAAICEQAARRFADMGVEVVEAKPNFSEAMECFHTLRAAGFVTSLAATLRDHRDKLKPEVIWNIERGLALDADQIAAAQLARGRLFKSAARFFESHDLLLCPAAIVPPFDVDTRYVEEVNGQRFETYIDWIAITFAVTLTSCPAVSVPAGFTAAGLPVGLQIVGPPRGEAEALTAAALLDDASGISKLLPIDPKPSVA